MKRFLALMILGILALLLVSCQGKTELPSPTASLEGMQSGAYPSPQGDIQTGTNPSSQGVDQGEAYPESLSANQTGSYPASQNDISTYPIGSGEQQLPTQITPNPPADAPDPEPGKASISGTLYSPTQKMVIPGTQFYLTPGWGDDHREVPPVFLGPQVDKGDVSLMTDSQGNFSSSNIPPGTYYLAVWAPLTWDVATVSETDTKPLLLELNADQKYPYGIVYVSWP